MPFTMNQKVLFKHCDPAGIVFFPRYYEMINDCVEAFFDIALEYPFEALHQFGGVPTVQINTQFCAPSRHGDQLEITLECTRLGHSSLTYMLNIFCGDERRMKTEATLVHVGDDGKSAAWPQVLKTALKKQFEENANVS